MLRKITYQEALAKMQLKQSKRKPLKRKSLADKINEGLDKLYSPRKPKTARRTTLKRGSMVKPIPLKMREELAEDPFMQECCLRHIECQGALQWHHNLMYASKRINEKGAILPLCEFHHRKEGKYKDQLNFIMELRMTDEEKAKYPKRKWL